MQDFHLLVLRAEPLSVSAFDPFHVFSFHLFPFSFGLIKAGFVVSVFARPARLAGQILRSR